MFTLQTDFNPLYVHFCLQNTSEPGHEKMCLISYAINKGADQPAHSCSLLTAFVVRCLGSIISLDSLPDISRLQLVSVAAQNGLSLAWSEIPEDTFCGVVAQVYLCLHICFNDISLSFLLIRIQQMQFSWYYV